MTRKRGKPITFAWRDRIRTELWGREHGTPNHTQMIAVAAVLEAYANPDGSNVRPSLATIAREAGTNRNTANEAIRAMEQRSLLRRTGKAAKGVIVYRLQLPTPDTEPEPTSSPASSNRSSNRSSIKLDTQPTTNHPKGGGGGDSAAGGLAATPQPATAQTAEANQPTGQPAATGTDTTSSQPDPHALNQLHRTFDLIETNLRNRRRTNGSEPLRIKRYNQPLRTITASRLETGWTPEQIATEATCDLPADERKISSVTGLICKQISQLPAQPETRPTSRQHTTPDDDHTYETQARTRHQHLPPIEREASTLADLEQHITSQILESIAPGNTVLTDQIADAICEATTDPAAEQSNAQGLAAYRNQIERLRTWRDNTHTNQPVGPFELQHLPTIHSRTRGQMIAPPISHVLEHQPGDDITADRWHINPEQSRRWSHALTIEAEQTAYEAQQREAAAADTIKRQTETLAKAINLTTQPTTNPTQPETTWSTNASHN
jgi:hypothetical protein